MTPRLLPRLLPLLVSLLVTQAFGGTLQSSDRFDADPSASSTTEHGASVSVAGNGSYLLVWQEQVDDGYTVLARRINAVDGTPVETSPRNLGLSLQSSYLSATFDGTNFLVVWQRDLTSLEGVRLRASDGVLLDETPVRLGPVLPMMLRPTVTFDGTFYLLLWNGLIYPESGGQDIRIQGIRLRTSDLTAVESEPFTLVSGIGDFTLDYHVATRDGRSLLVWSWGDQGVKAIRLGATGQSLDTSPLTLTTTSAKVRVASKGEEFLVLWSESSGWESKLKARRVRFLDGALPDAQDILVTNSADVVRDPTWHATLFDVVFDGQDYRTLFQSFGFFNGDFVFYVASTRVSAQGSVGPGAREVLTAYDHHQRGLLSLSAQGPARFLVGYNEGTEAPNTDHVRYRLISPVE